MGEHAVTSVDDAFDNLLGKNAIAIPVASPAPETRAAAPEGFSAAIPAAAVHNGNCSEAGDMSAAMRVLDLIDENAGDYLPRHYATDDNERVFATPTEADLEPVGNDSGGEETVVAALPGTSASVVDDEYGGDATGGAPADASGGEPADTQIDVGGGAELQKARRFRRFSYLPLGGMEHFESRARDIMASLASQEPDCPSLALASPARGDGQTELAIRLALAMAKRVDYRVLLADFDVRKPHIAPRLGLSSKYFTLSDVLRGSCPLGEALMVSEEDNLYVLPARASDRVGDEVLNDKQVQALMAKIHANFDFTVISCGAADHADAAIVCRHAGATALAAACRRTRAKALRDAADTLEDAGANIVGMLLTGA